MKREYAPDFIKGLAGEPLSAKTISGTCPGDPIGETSVESLLVTHPSRIMYSVPIKNFPIRYKKEKNAIIFRLVDGSHYENTNSIFDFDPLCTNVTPGKVYLQDIWVMSENIFKGMIPTRVVLSIPQQKVLQDLSGVENLLYILHNHGCPVLYNTMFSLPVFFSRDPAYGFPLFLSNQLEVRMEYTENEPPPSPDIRLSMEILHSQEEYSLAISSHSIWEGKITREFSFFAPTWWNFLGTSISRIPQEPISFSLVYDGGTDEEIRGVFFRITYGMQIHIKHMEICFHYEEGHRMVLPILYKESFTDVVYRERDTRILPTVSCKDQQIISTDLDYGGVLFSRSFDTKDCEPGLVPRNGKLVFTLYRDGGLETDPAMEINVYTLTNRDLFFTRM